MASRESIFVVVAACWAAGRTFLPHNHNQPSVLNQLLRLP